MIPRVAIVGGGAAGLMASAALLEEGMPVAQYLIERNNSLGKKVLISGGGRCNVTTGLPSLQEILKRYPRGSSFLKPAFHRAPPQAVMSWFEAHGVPLKTEADQRVFPISDRGSDIVGVFEDLFQHSSCTVLLGHAVTQIQKTSTGFQLFFKEQTPLEVEYLVLTTGGQAYRHTGSTGDGYAFAEALGHTITPLAASLNAFLTKEAWPKQLAGVSLPDANLYIRPGVEARGPFLFTHQGMTGPAVFALSSQIAFETYDLAHPLPVFMDLQPSLSATILQTQLIQFVRTHPKKHLLALLESLLPRSLAEQLIQSQKIAYERHLCEYPQTLFKELAELLKAVPLHLVGRTAGEEFVTAGGVETGEVNPRTMESYLCPRLYLAGELLNIDGYTGGFNLQASWATGRIAGESIAAALRDVRA